MEVKSIKEDLDFLSDTLKVVSQGNEDSPLVARGIKSCATKIDVSSTFISLA